MKTIDKQYKFTHSTGINVYEVSISDLFADERLADKTPIEMSIEDFNEEDEFDKESFFGCSIKSPLCIYNDGRIDDGHHRFMLYQKLNIKTCPVYFIEDLD